MEYIEVGYSSKSFGVKGELKCFFNKEYLQDVLNASALFFYINGQYIPYFTEDIIFDRFFKLKLEEIHSKEAANPLHNKAIYLRTQDVSEIQAEVKISDWKGYTVWDLNSNKQVGLIQEIHELPEQLLAELNWNNKKVFIPLHESLIEEHDSKRKIIKMKLAEGLLDL